MGELSGWLIITLSYNWSWEKGKGKGAGSIGEYSTSAILQQLVKVRFRREHVIVPDKLHSSRVAIIINAGKISVFHWAPRINIYSIIAYIPLIQNKK